MLKIYYYGTRSSEIRGFGCWDDGKFGSNLRRETHTYTYTHTHTSIADLETRWNKVEQGRGGMCGS